MHNVVINVGNIDPGDTVLSGTTDANGDFEFTQNPYLTATLDFFNYDTILMVAIKDQDTTWTWLHFYDPSNAWFAKQDTVFRKSITLP